MKRFLQLTLIIALAVGAVSCKKDEIINTVKEAPKDTPTVKNLPPKQKITLSASSTKPGLRVAYDASKGTDVADDNTLWEEGDSIAVYNVGVNGSRATFKLVDGAGTSYGTFEGEIEPTGNYYGIYPFSAAGDLDGTSIAITLPATQNYAEGSFGQNAAVFAATSTIEGDDVVLHFEPLLGYLSLSLKTPANGSRNTATSIVGDHSVGSIVLHENSLGEVALSGNATVDMSSADYEHNIPPTLSVAPGGSLDVTLNCSPSVQLTEDSIEFIIAVPAGAFRKGLCATVNGTDGKKIMSLATTTASDTITANYITQLPAQDVYNIEDVEGRRYPVAKIGSQIWMGENMQSLTYEEGTSGKENNITITPAASNPEPHYYFEPNYGYLYNLAAAAGICPVPDPDDDKKTIFPPTGYTGEKQQGICPNGWHVPSISELYGGLQAYVEEEGVRDGRISGAWMRTVSGWADIESYDFLQGTDDFGFSATPAGYGIYSNEEVGWGAHFLTATLIDDYSIWGLMFHSIDVGYDDEFGFEWWGPSTQACLAVRCLKDY